MGTFLTWLLYYLPGFSTSELLFFGRKSLGVGRVDYTPPPGQGVIYIVCFYNSSVRKISFFSLLYFFIQSFIYITVFSCIFILYFGLWSSTPLFMLLLRSSWLWPLERFQDWLLCPFDVSPSFGYLSSAFLSGTSWCMRITLYCPCPSPRISHFSTGPSFLLGQEV